MTTQQALIEQWRAQAEFDAECGNIQSAQAFDQCADELEALVSPVSGDEEGRKEQEEKHLSRGEPSVLGTPGASRSPLSADSDAVQATCISLPHVSRVCERGTEGCIVKHSVGWCDITSAPILPPPTERSLTESAATKCPRCGAVKSFDHSACYYRPDERS